jgi:transposase
MKHKPSLPSAEALDAFIGLDLGDRFTAICLLDPQGELHKQARCHTTREGFAKHFANRPRARIALEAGSQSAWISRQLRGYGHEVIVANPRQLALISKNILKTDPGDAETLARLARADQRLLRPVYHRSAETQAHLSILRARDTVVHARTMLVNCARGLAKQLGHRLPACASTTFSKRAKVPAELADALEGLLKQIDQLSETIKDYNARLERIAREHYAAPVRRLTSVHGVGTLTALAFILILGGDPARFAKSRDVGPYLGLNPKRRQSGEQDPQLGITKAGNSLLRRLLVQCAHHLLGRFGPDSALRQWGLAMAARGGTRARKRAVVAVARKLAVLLHHLWVSGEDFEAFPARRRHPAPEPAR